MVDVPVPVTIDGWPWPEMMNTRYLTQRYTRRQFPIGRTTLTIWVADDMPEIEAATALAEIILAPHDKARR